MKLTYIKHTAIAILAFVFSAAANGAMIAIATYTTSSSNIDSGQITASATSGVYFTIGTITYNTIDPDDFDRFELNSGHLIGRNTTDGSLTIRHYPGEIGTNETVSGVTITAGTVVNFAFKHDLDTGNWSFWLNPNFNKLESENTAALSDIAGRTQDNTWVKFSATDTGGTPSGYTGSVSYTNFAFYNGGDTPFIVPEPATYALIFGALALGFVMLRRRFKA